MKRSNGYRISLVLFGFVAAVALGGGSAKADFIFGKPVNLGPVLNSAYGEAIDSISSDGLELYFSSNRPGGQGAYDLWVLKRASADDDWGPAENLGPAVNSPSQEAGPSISADGLALYFHSNRPGGHGDFDIWVTRRATKDDSWGEAVNMGPTINCSGSDGESWIAPDSLELYFASSRSGGYGGYDIYVARRATQDDLWGEAVNLGPVVNSAYNEQLLSLSPDGLLLLFSDNPFQGTPRPGGYAEADMWMARRTSLSAPWQTPVNFGRQVNGPAPDAEPRISPDGRTLYFFSERSGSYDNWQAPIIPIVDFNGDGKVDIRNLLRLIESWGKDDPSVDMGPMPWGDGKVDEKDLEVLMSYWGQEIGLLACWKLDEAEGQIAADSAGTNDGLLVGNPVWQLAGGKIAGALQFDGVDDCVRSPFVVDPAAGPLSVFAWVKGGTPGQVIVSQADGANWLMAADPGGMLMTDLKLTNRKPKALTSAVVITDGIWHRVGLSWDGSNRILYVDDIEVAKDTQASLPSSVGGLYIGAGSTLAAGSFWSGLMDDVRIYDRAVKP